MKPAPWSTRKSTATHPLEGINVSKCTANTSPAGTPENSPAIHRWVIVRERNESRQGRAGCSADSRVCCIADCQSARGWIARECCFAEGADVMSRVGNPRYSSTRQSRNPIVLLLVLVLDCPVSDYENEDDDEDEKFALPATISSDTADWAVRATFYGRLSSCRVAGTKGPCATCRGGAGERFFS